MQVRNIANNVTATGPAPSVDGARYIKTYQVYGKTASGSGSAVVDIEGSTDGVAWDKLGSITLTLGPTITSDSFTAQDRYALLRANVQTLTGSGATVQARMSF